MKNNIRLTESQLRALVSEASKKVLNEISLDTIGNAENQSNNWRRGDYDPWDSDAWKDIINYNDIFDAIRDINIALEKLGGDYPTEQKFLGYLEEIWNFFERKESQHENFKKTERRKNHETRNEILQRAKQFGATDLRDWDAAFNSVPEDRFNEFAISLSKETREWLNNEGFLDYNSKTGEFYKE